MYYARAMQDAIAEARRHGGKAKKSNKKETNGVNRNMAYFLFILSFSLLNLFLRAAVSPW
jgi:hypothetical protein